MIRRTSNDFFQHYARDKSVQVVLRRGLSSC